MRPYLCKTNPIPGGRGRNTEALAMPEAGTRRSSAHRVLDSMRRHGAKNADYRGGVTCLYDTQLLGACLHASGCGGHSRPGAVRGMPEVPIAPPATGPNTVRHGICAKFYVDALTYFVVTCYDP